MEASYRLLDQHGKVVGVAVIKLTDWNGPRYLIELEYIGKPPGRYRSGRYCMHKTLAEATKQLESLGVHCGFATAERISG